MPLIPADGLQQQQKPDWRRALAERIHDNELLPIVGNVAINDLVMEGHRQLADQYAAYTARLNANHRLKVTTLPQMVQYRSLLGSADLPGVKKDYVNFIKNRAYDLARNGADEQKLAEVADQFDALTFVEMCRQLGFPALARQPEHTLLLLASLDLSIFLTTSPHKFLELALEAFGKEPQVEFCRWNDYSKKQPQLMDPAFKPDSNRPLVYHLYGLDEYPGSMVLTEDDHLQFLIACRLPGSGPDTHAVHPLIRGALSSRSPMLLGYGLRDWDFRALFWGLIQARSNKDWLGVIAQLEPSEEEKAYLEKYFEGPNFNVYWGTAEQFVKMVYDDYAEQYS